MNFRELSQTVASQRHHIEAFRAALPVPPDCEVVVRESNIGTLLTPLTESTALCQQCGHVTRLLDEPPGTLSLWCPCCRVERVFQVS